MKECNQKGYHPKGYYTYFALDGGHCRCGKNLPCEIDRKWKKQDESHCNRVCGGDPNAKCGRRPERGISVNVYNVYKDPCQNYPYQLTDIADPYDPSCRRWIECSNGVFKQSGSCNSTERFNPDELRCVAQHEMPCHDEEEEDEEDDDHNDHDDACNNDNKVTISQETSVTNTTTTADDNDNIVENITDHTGDSANTIDERDQGGYNVIHVAIGAAGGAFLLIIGGLVTFFILRRAKCCNRKRASEEGQEMTPISETEKPIPVQKFRQSESHWMPKEEEFDELNRVDLRKNAMTKSKEDGRYFVREHIPLNR